MTDTQQNDKFTISEQKRIQEIIDSGETAFCKPIYGINGEIYLDEYKLHRIKVRKQLSNSKNKYRIAIDPNVQYKNGKSETKICINVHVSSFLQDPWRLHRGEAKSICLSKLDIH